MLYLIFPSEQAAKDRSDEIATGLGCQQDSTSYWFGWTTNETYWALMIPEDETDKLTPIEVTELKDQAYMEANGWFPPTNIP